MKNNNQHIDLNRIDSESKEFFQNGTFQWNRSQEDVWASVQNQMQNSSEKKIRKVNFRILTYAAAAIILLLIGVGSFLKMYTTTVETEAGKHLTAQLPDGSIVQLNAVSKLSYHPYWWQFSREVVFQGEGFFQVEKGKTFKVIAQRATTEVLGTSFNVFARDEILKVTCITGKVKVTSSKQKEAILTPETKAEVDEKGDIIVTENVDAKIEISWCNNFFFFTATPIHEVFREIERQFGIQLISKTNNYLLYTGNFKKGNNVEEVLSLVCPPMGLDYIKQPGKKYVIFENN